MLEGAANGAEEREKCHGGEKSEHRGVGSEEDREVDTGGQEREVCGARVHGHRHGREERSRREVLRGEIAIELVNDVGVIGVYQRLEIQEG